MTTCRYDLECVIEAVLEEELEDFLSWLRSGDIPEDLVESVLILNGYTHVDLAGRLGLRDIVVLSNEFGSRGYRRSLDTVTMLTKFLRACEDRNTTKE